MTSEGLGEMFEGNSADACAGKFPLVSMGVRAECSACADTGARTPICARGITLLVVLGIKRPSAGEDLLHAEPIHLLRDLVLLLLFFVKQVSVCHLKSWRVTGHLWIL